MNIFGVSSLWYIPIVLIILYLIIGIFHAISGFDRICSILGRKWKIFLLPLALLLLIIGWLPFHIYLYCTVCKCSDYLYL